MLACFPRRRTTDWHENIVITIFVIFKKSFPGWNYCNNLGYVDFKQNNLVLAGPHKKARKRVVQLETGPKWTSTHKNAIEKKFQKVGRALLLPTVSRSVH